jgi:chromosome segregation ATPase
MIDNSNQPNVQLTFEQLQQIDVATKRLNSLKDATIEENKNLFQLKAQVSSTTKEKDYQLELLEKASLELSQASSKLVDVKGQLEVATEELSEVRKENEEISANQTAREMRLKDKEDDMVVRQNTLESEIKSFREEKKALEEDKAIHNKKVSKLKEVIENL